MNQLYNVLGASKQAVHQYSKRQTIFDEEVTVLLSEIQKLRREHPGCGVEKMYYTLKPSFIGRDRFIELFMDLGFRIKRNKNYKRTTFGSKFYCPNFIQGMLLYSPSQVWQSDITYISVSDRFYYVVFIIDVYTKVIVGYQVSDNMRAEANVKALTMAFKEHNPPNIHHSDKGSQYIYKGYTELLRSNGVTISMGETAMDNAYAERINLTIKSEYLDYWKPQCFDQLKRMVKKAVTYYNEKRPHNYILRKTPMDFYKEVLSLKMHDRPTAMIYTEGRKIEKGFEPFLDFSTTNTLAPNCPIIEKNER
jgi:hypothetical protein